MASTLPATTPATHPARAGRPTRLRYATTTCAGVRPMLFSTPIRWYPATTAPLTTLATMSTAMARPISANATTNGSMIAPLLSDWLSAASHEPDPVTVPGGSAPVTSARSARTWDAVPALVNRYSSCALGGAPGACKKETSAGATHPSALLVIELAKPTTVSVTGCASPATDTVFPSVGPPPPDKPFSTICPGPVTQ